MQASLMRALSLQAFRPQRQSAQIVSVFNAHRRYRMSKARVQRYVKKVLGRRNGLISIVFVDSHRCKSINRTFLGQNFVTDVISFPLDPLPHLEGEVYVNLDRAKQQAKEYNVSFENEVARLVIHGTLHLIGYDDVNASDAKEMKLKENAHVQFWFSSPQRKDGF